jgi:hypothetical protein
MSPLSDDVGAKIQQIRQAFANQRAEQAAAEAQDAIASGTLRVSLGSGEEKMLDIQDFSNFNDFHDFHAFQNFNDFKNFNNSL